MAPENRTIQDNYEILGEIGKGGMARVLKARQTSLHRLVAIKEIKPAIAQNPELVERFKREARTSASLVHESIVQVYNFGEPEKGALFIIMEFVEGYDLKTLLKKAGTVPPRIAALLVKEVARALAYAHARGLVHRDVKPGNVMVSLRGDVKLMDFGIVREMDSDLTKTGAFLGTPSYMAPEQFLGEEITPRADIFSLGVVLYEILTGEKPFRSDSEGSLAKKVRTQKEAKVRSINPDVPRRLQNLVHKCMAKQPRRRPGSCEDIARDLDKIAAVKSREEQRRELTGWVRDLFEMGPSGLDPVEIEAPAKVQKAARALVVEEAAGDRTDPSIRPELSLREKMKARREQKEDLSEEDMIELRAKEQARERAEEARAEKSGRAQNAAAKKSGAGKAGRRQEDRRESGTDAPPRPRGKKSNPKGQPAGEAADPRAAEAGDVVIKWVWRLILLAIAAMAAVIVFLMWPPEAKSAGTGPKDAPPARFHHSRTQS